MNTKLKICGLYRDQDIHSVNQFPPDYVGFILHFPKSHRNVTAEQVIAWKKILKPDIKTVGVFVNQTMETISHIAPYLDVIQLHGTEPETFAQELKTTFPETEIWKAFPVKTKEDIASAFLYPADKILLDYGKGEGKTFDWSLLEGINQPYILAGGLNPDNIRQAIAAQQPYMVDLSSGVETDKRKDPAKIQQLYKEMKS